MVYWLNQETLKMVWTANLTVWKTLGSFWVLPETIEYKKYMFGEIFSVVEEMNIIPIEMK